MPPTDVGRVPTRRDHGAYAHVVIDIPTRALSQAFTYAVPAALGDACRVGAPVLVRFSRRMVIGYIVGLVDVLPDSLSDEQVLPIERVLGEPVFDLVHADLALWMAREYACSLAEALHPLLPPGQSPRVRRSASGEPWELTRTSVGSRDERWAMLTDVGPSYEPPPRAARQRTVLEALAAGPLRMAELGALVSGAPAVVRALEKKGVVVVEARRVWRGADSIALSSAAAQRPTSYTTGQKQALAAIERACREKRGDVVLVDGVTGSGKTEVYLAAIERVRAAGQGALVLVPEISLTAQTVGRFRSRFGDDVAVLHSRLSVGERFDQWDLIRRGEAHVVVGARSALFAPMAQVGLIIIDEEHEWTYKQQSAPRYHARDVAAWLAAHMGATLVLGSATPSLESIVRCEATRWRGACWTRVEMSERPGVAELPRVRAVDMALQFRRGNRRVFSKPLQESLLAVAERREKAVLLLNRRGFASFLMCRDCGCVPQCPHCSTSLTYHERTHSLMCHTCARSWPATAWPNPMTRCPNCGSRYLGAFGVGTQRIEDELRMLLPSDVEIVRMDADTTRGKGAHQRLLERFDAAESAVLVGTQMIAKGLDFPEVTLVGVVNADTTLKLSDFRAAERTYCLLEQVAGRAGRGNRAGEVIIQTYWPSHPAIQAVIHHDRELFLAPELVERRDAGYPPYARLANIVVWGGNGVAVAACAQSIAAALRGASEKKGWEVLGPAECLHAKIKDRIRFHVLVKAPAGTDMGPLLSRAVSGVTRPSGMSVTIDVDPLDLM